MFQWFTRSKTATKAVRPQTTTGSSFFGALFGGLFGGSQMASSGVRVGPVEALSLSSYYAAIQLLAGDIAKTPLRVYRRVAVSDQVGLDAPEHRLHPLLNIRANQWQTAFNWKETTASHLLMFGNAFSVILRDQSGTPQELLPIYPSRVQTYLADDGTLFYRLDGGSLYERLIARDLPVMIPAEHMLAIRGLTIDGFEGIYPLAAGRDSLGMALATEEHAAQMFKNGTVLSGTLNAPNKLTDVAFERLRASWSNNYSGTGNAYKTAILEDGITWSSLGMTAEDAQLLDSRKFSTQEIARRFGIPQHKLGILDKATNNNIEQQALEYVTGILTTIAARIEQAVSAALLRPEEMGTFYLDFDFSELLRGDLKTTSEAVARLQQSGTITANEGRQKFLRLPPIAGGDVLLTPLHMSARSDPQSSEPQPIPGENP